MCLCHAHEAEVMLWSHSAGAESWAWVFCRGSTAFQVLSHLHFFHTNKAEHLHPFLCKTIFFFGIVVCTWTTIWAYLCVGSYMCMYVGGCWLGVLPWELIFREGVPLVLRLTLQTRLAGQQAEVCSSQCRNYESTTPSLAVHMFIPV